VWRCAVAGGGSIACGQLDIGNATESASPSGFPARQQPWRGEQDPSPTMDEPTCTGEDCARAVLYMASLPLSANVLQMTVMATNAPLVGRG
jgi:hypothetical protein